MTTEQTEKRVDEFGQEIIACKVCKGDTTMLGTKLCDRCWQLGSAFRSLLSDDKDTARLWLEARLIEIERGEPCEA